MDSLRLQVTSIIWNSPVGNFVAANPWYYTAGAIISLYLVVAILGFVARIVFKHGQIIKYRLGTISNPKYARDVFVVSGDVLAEVIHEEMFGTSGHAYLKHGIVLPTKFIRDKAPALVIDVGANVGLFGLSMEVFGEEDLADSRSCRVPDNNNNNNNSTVIRNVGNRNSEVTSDASSSSSSPRTQSARRRSASAARKSEIIGRRASSTSGTTTTTSTTTTTTSAEAAAYTGTLLPAVRVIGFEPIPETYECCRRNYDQIFHETNKAFPQHASSVYQVGIGATKATATFHYDSCSSAAASMHLDDITQPFSGKIIKTIGAWLIDFGRYPLDRIRSLREFLYAPFFATLFVMGKLLSLDFFPARLFFFVMSLPALVAMLVFRVFALPGSKKLTCQILTLPEALKLAHADDPDQSIAFLKIDVEGAEESVCNGIDDVTWARVHQAVIEVHDTPDGRCKRLVEMLKRQGFKKISVDEEPLELHKLGNIKTIFATRG